MPLQKLIFKPGLNRDQTNYAGEGGWYACDKVRFRSGFPEKIGGWAKATFNTYLGVCRQMWSWFTSFGDNLLALGTNIKVYINVGGNLYDITPLRETTAPGAVLFAATNGSNIITVSDSAHGAQPGDYVTFSGAASLGGNITAVVLNREYEIKTIVSANSYTIQATATANASDVTSSTFTATAASPTVLTFATYTPVNNDRLILSSTDTLPGGLNTTTVYYVVNAAGSTCNLSLTQGGATINASTTGTGTHTASLFKGGSNTIGAYQINIGLPGGTYGYGWGSGTWSRGAWGSGTNQPIYLGQTDWWFANFDNDLIMNRRDKFKGPIYIWERGLSTDPLTALNTRAVLLSSLSGASDVPLEAGILIVSQNDKHLLALGATTFGSSDFDPLLIRWANQDQPENWTPTATNSAGFLRLAKGSRIVTGLATRQEILVWTEGTLNSVQFTGTTDVFSLQELADNISIMGTRAAINVNNVVYWMGKDKFFVYSGRAETLPCTLRRHVFSNFNYEQSEQMFAATSEGFNEVWWFYCSKNATSPDSYVVFNYQENIWYYGTMNRTYWLDSPIRIYPVSVNGGFIYNQENTNDADGVAMESYIQSADIDLDDGSNFMLIKRIIPDVSFETSTAINPQVQFEILPRNFPGAPYQSELAQSVTLTGGTTVEEYTNQVFIRARARQLALKISSNTLGVAWQLGAPRIDGRPDGER